MAELAALRFHIPVSDTNPTANELKDAATGIKNVAVLLDREFLGVQEGLNTKQWELLSTLANRAQTMTLTELGRCLGCTRQYAKKMATTLQNRGLATMVASRQATQVGLTEHGWKVVEHITRNREAVRRKFFASVSTAELQKFQQLLQKLERAALQHHAQTGHELS